jgi:alpha-1,2-mannosyltransferase
MWHLSVTKPVNVRIAWLLWALLFVVASASTLAGRSREVTHHYRDASHHWFRGEELYANTGHGFLYFPQAAILFAPFAYLPFYAGEVAWRAVILLVFAAGVCRLTRLAGRTAGIDFFPLTTMFCLPLAFSSERNGQATLIMAGLMMLAAVDLADRRWWRAALYLSLGVAIKPLGLVMLLLAAVLYPATTWRLAICVGVLAIAPFSTAKPAYVLSQYADCIQMLGHAVDRGREANWAQLFGMLQVAGVSVPPIWQTVLRLLAALATLALLWHAQRRLPGAWAATYCYLLAVCFLMLFNPRTENNSYSALAPAIGILCCNDVLVRRKLIMALWYAVLALGILGTYYVGTLLTGPDYTTWLSPLMGVCFIATAILQLLLWPEPEIGNGSLNRPPMVAKPSGATAA